MKKLTAFTLIALSSFVFVSPVSAQLVSVTPEGGAVVNVLGSETVNLGIPDTSVEIKDVAQSQPAIGAQVHITKAGNKISLSVGSGNNYKEMDVTNWNDSLVQVEERPAVSSMSIGVSGQQFTLKQKGVTATTDYPLTIDSKTAKLSATTPTGSRYIAILPFQAVESILRAKTITSISPTGNLQLVEENNNLLYLVSGTKDITFFKFYTHSFPVEGKVSALDGSIISTNEPPWLKVLEYFFS